MSHPLQIAEKTILIAGAQSRLGASLAMKLADFGANVCLVDSDEKIISRVSEQIRDQHDIRESHGRASFVVTNPEDPKSLAEAARKTVETFGSIDIYVDTFNFYKRLPAQDEKNLQELDRFINVNLKAPLLLTYEVLRFLKTRRHGRIIYVVPDMARIGVEGDSLLAATRTGLINYAKTLSRELHGPNHITVNCVAVGLTEEYLISRDPKQTSLKDAQSEYAKQIPHAKLSDPNDVAEVVAFLASPKSASITGQILAANNGLSVFG